MKPLILTVIFIAAVYAKPGVFNLPAPTPSAPPAIISSLATSTPSITPSSLVQSISETEVGGAPVINIGGGQSQGLPFTSPSLSFGQLGLNLGQSGFDFTQSGLGFAQPGLSLTQQGFGFTQPGLGFTQSGLNFGQGLGFGEQLLNIGPPQVNFGADLSSVPLNLAPISPTVAPVIGPTIASVGPTVEPIISSTLGSVVGSTLGPTVGPTIGPTVVSTIGVDSAPIIGQTIGSTLAPPPESAVASGFGPTFVPAIAPTQSTVSLSLFEGTSGVGSAPSGITTHKHVYVYVAPEEPEVISPPKPIVFPAPQKHYKIIFIKAPSPPKLQVPVIPVLPQNEEKTIVYVLAKRPEAQPEVHIQTPPPTQPPKPEVYFIRYHTQKEVLDSGIKEKEPEVKIDVRGGPPSITVSDAGLNGVALDLNTASLSGGSALSTAVQESTTLNSLEVSSTPIPKYGPPLLK